MKQVLIIRTKYPNINGVRKGKLIAQGAHASVTAVINGIDNTSTRSFVEKWYHKGQTKIVVYVKSEEELLEIWQKVQEQDIPKALIKDAGKTEFGGHPTYTAIAIGPAPINKIDPITSHLPLL